MSDINRYDRTTMSARWQDWITLVLAVWLFISPWILGFAIGGNAAGVQAVTGAAMASPAWDAWVFGVIAAAIAIWAMFNFAPWQEWLSLLIGIWLFVAPWVLGFSSAQNPAWDHWIVGVLVFVVGLSALPYARGSGVSYTHAGNKPLMRDPLAGPIDRPLSGDPIARDPLDQPLDRP